MEFLVDYLAFALRLLTVVVLIGGALLVLVLAATRRSGGGDGEELKIRSLNDVYDSLSHGLRSATLTGKAAKAAAKAERKAAKERAKSGDERPRLFLLRFDGDIRASATESLRQEVSAIVRAAEDGDEVALVLESGGGTIHGYGLAAAQLARLRDKKLPLTVCVDRVAASGGYMMACVANHLRAAPFAIIGSIGVVMQLPNFNRLLKENHIDYELVTAGKHKRTLTLLGENSDEGREKVREELEQAHGLFQHFITHYRPGVDLDKVATGEHWFGQQALDLALVDELGTSDDFLLDAAERFQILEVTFRPKKKLSERLLRMGSEQLRRLGLPGF